MRFSGLPQLYLLGIRFPRSVLIGSLLLTAIAFWGAQKLKIENDFTAFLPPETESVQNLHRLKEYFGGSGFLIATVESNKPKLSRSFADAYAGLIQQHPSVMYVDHPRPVDFFKKRLWLYIDAEDLNEIERRIDRNLELQEKGISPVFNDIMSFVDKEDLPDFEFNDIREKYQRETGWQEDVATTAEDGKMVILPIKIKQSPQNLDTNRALISDLRKMEQKLKQKDEFSAITVAYTGNYQQTIEQADQISSEMTMVLIAVAFLLLLILYFYFKRISSAFLIGIPLAIGIVWTGGLVYLILGHLNIITAFAAAILAGLGSDYGIYLLTRIFSEQQAGNSFRKACHIAFSRTGLATRASMITTLGAFSALLFSRFGLFVEFGIVGALGIVLSYLAIILILPSLLVLSTKILDHPAKAHARFTLGPRLMAFLAPRAALPVLVGVALLVAFATLSLSEETKVIYEDGLLENKELPSYQLNDRISQSLKMPLSPTLLMVRSHEEETKVISKLDALLEQDTANKLVFNKVYGQSTFYPSDQQAKKTILKRIHDKYGKLRIAAQKEKDEFLNSLQQSMTVAEFTTHELPQEVRRMFESQNDKDIFAVYLRPAFARSTSSLLKRYHEGILSLKTHGLKFMAVDGTFVSDDTLRLIEREAPRGMFFILAFLCLFLGFVIQPFKRAVVIMVHLIASLIMLSGILWLLEIRLNVLNIAMIPIILGTGIDSFIHMNQRFDESNDLTETLRNKILPIFISNLTSMVGFGGLLLTSSAGLRSAGWVAVIGILVMIFFCTYVFPRYLSLEQAERSRVLAKFKTKLTDF